jgi:hypothetical protein
MVDYRVIYHDGRTHIITAERFGPYGENYVFERDGKDAAIIPRAIVESVMVADIPEPDYPEEPPKPPFGFSA